MIGDRASLVTSRHCPSLGILVLWWRWPRVLGSLISLISKILVEGSLAVSAADSRDLLLHLAVWEEDSNTLVEGSLAVSVPRLVRLNLTLVEGNSSEASTALHRTLVISGVLTASRLLVEIALDLPRNLVHCQI